jgi:hypothetical protein
MPQTRRSSNTFCDSLIASLPQTERRPGCGTGPSKAGVLGNTPVSAKCQERISERRCTAAQSFNPCDSTYLAKPPVHAKQESSNEGGGDKAVAEDASGTKI